MRLGWKGKWRSGRAKGGARGTHPVLAVSIRAVLSCTWAVWPGEEDELAPLCYCVLSYLKLTRDPVFSSISCISGCLAQPPCLYKLLFSA